jgi:hypothetical protein
MPSEILQILIEAQARTAGASQAAVRDINAINDAVNKAALISAKADADMAVSRQKTSDNLRVIDAKAAADTISTREKVTGQLEVIDTKSVAQRAALHEKHIGTLAAIEAKGDATLFAQAERNRGTLAAIEAKASADVTRIREQRIATVEAQTAKALSAQAVLQERYALREAERTRIAQERTLQTAQLPSNPLTRLSSQIDDFIGPAAGLATSLARVAMVAAPIAAAGAAVFSLTKGLGDAGQIAVQTERKFAAFSGGTAQAADNLAMMRAATDNGLAAMDAMGASSMLLSMGLADSGAKAAELTRMAMMLGPAWRDAQTNIQDFTMLLANQSIRRLDQFGLSVEGVRAKQQELMDQGFAKDIAFTNAVLEIGATKMLQLEKAGVVAATGARQLEAAWKDLRMEISKPFAEPVSQLEAALAKGLRDVGNVIKGATKDPSTRTRDDLIRMREVEIDELARRMGRQRPGVSMDAWEVEETASKIRGLSAAIDALDETKLPKLAASARQLPDTIDRAGSAMLGLVYATSRLPDSIDMEFRIKATQFPSLGKQTAPTYSYLPSYEDTEGQYGSSRYSPGISDPNSTAKRVAQAELDAINDFNRAMQGAAKSTENAFDKAASAVASHFDKAVSASIGLRDFRPGGAGGMSGPGANGAFEDIYRLQAWLTDNSWGSVAEKYGIKDKAQGTDIVKKFQSGLWDESVTKLIDEDKIKAAVLTDKQAEAYKKAFAEKIAAATGTGTDVAAAAIWGKEYTDSSAQTAKMTATGQSMGGALITGIGKAEPDLWTAGYNAAMAMMAGWNAATSGKPNDGGKPPNGSSGYNSKQNEYGIN